MPTLTPVQPVRCLGCAMATGTHQCAGAAELLPFGGYCGCPLPYCGPAPVEPRPDARRPRRRA
ncbi:hypothetical protein ABZX66_28080 [Micromonospora aurantiaca]|uniref:hypothetical protein n=1 Tax=Micromonospora aurantiaca (nom. illeg.) TaxID=47850 RepID=UPI0033AFAF69